MFKMATNKKSFIAYCDWRETFDTLPDEKAGQLIKHIFAYVSDENPKSDDILINAVFANIKQTLKRDLEKWESQQQQRINAGKASAKSRKRNSTTVERPLNDRLNSSTVNVNDSVSVSVNDNVNEIDIFYLKKEDFLKTVQDNLKGYFIDISIDELKKEAEIFINGRLTSCDTNRPFYEYADHFKNTVKKNFKEKTPEKKTKFKCWALNTTRYFEVETEEEAKQKFYNDTGAYPTEITKL